MTVRTSHWMALTAVALALAACGGKDTSDTQRNGQSDDARQAPASAAAAQAPDAAEEAWFDKANSHIALSNGLRKFLGDQNAFFRERELADEAKVAAGDFSAIRKDSHYFDDGFASKAEEILALPADTAAADAALRTLAAAASTHVSDWKALETYNKTRRDREDGGAEGRRLLPGYVAGQQALRTALIAYNDAVRTLSRESERRSEARYRAEGRMVELYTTQAMADARSALELFQDEADFKDKAKVEQANAAVKAMEDKIASARKEIEASKAAGDKYPPGRLSSMGSVLDSLEGFAGGYRQTRDVNINYHEQMVSRFNDAVQSYNRFQ